MSSHDETLKLVTNLDRAGIESRLAEVRGAAQAAGFAELPDMLASHRSDRPIAANQPDGQHADAKAPDRHQRWKPPFQLRGEIFRHRRNDQRRITRRSRNRRG
jgi:hypothetical protein